MEEEKVKKASHCAWQIDYHVVMPVKYRRALIDERVERVMKFKSIIARELFERERWLKKELWGGNFWSSGYYVGTVGERGNWAMVEKYVMDQGQPKEDLRQLTLW